jgi:hypothetical protein
VAVLRWLIGVATDWRNHWRAQGVPLNNPGVCRCFYERERRFLNRVHKFDSCRRHSFCSILLISDHPTRQQRSAP